MLNEIYDTLTEAHRDLFKPWDLDDWISDQMKETGAKWRLNVRGNKWVVEGDVVIPIATEMTQLPVSFVSVSGNFIAEDVSLTTLKGCPSVVGGSFNVSHNPLQTLEFGPYIVHGNYMAMDCDIVDLRCGETVCVGDFSVMYNRITTLYGMPKYVGGDLIVAHNRLENLGNTAAVVVEGKIYYFPQSSKTTALGSDWWESTFEGDREKRMSEWE